jgi:hypothetical protein
MRTQARQLLAALTFAASALAQTQAEPVKAQVASEKLWKIEASGISG